jgi:hypothetical protein
MDDNMVSRDDTLKVCYTKILFNPDFYKQLTYSHLLDKFFFTTFVLLITAAWGSTEE